MTCPSSDPLMSRGAWRSVGEAHSPEGLAGGPTSVPTQRQVTSLACARMQRSRRLRAGGRERGSGVKAAFSRRAEPEDGCRSCEKALGGSSDAPVCWRAKGAEVTGWTRRMEQQNAPPQNVPNADRGAGSRRQQPAARQEAHVLNLRPVRELQHAALLPHVPEPDRVVKRSGDKDVVRVGTRGRRADVVRVPRQARHLDTAQHGRQDSRHQAGCCGREKGLLGPRRQRWVNDQLGRRACVPESASHKRTVMSSPPEKRCSLSAENCTVCTPRL